MTNAPWNGVRVACAICAVGAALLAVVAGNDLYFTGFPDSHLTDYDKAAALPKRILMWGQWGLSCCSWSWPPGRSILGTAWWG
ncbi:hypothetical protein ACTXG7_19550 [Mycolicibacterium sp. Dal123E01]|uniref:hypothetical protein n=1 Tax=Mycolicibacterium sp. Dal123E01 TaxID=3457578 RepID=UPI00403E659C